MQNSIINSLSPVVAWQQETKIMKQSNTYHEILLTTSSGLLNHLVHGIEVTDPRTSHTPDILEKVCRDTLSPEVIPASPHSICQNDDGFLWKVLYGRHSLFLYLGSETGNHDCEFSLQPESFSRYFCHN